MSKEDDVLRFLLPDLLGKPKWGTDEKGNLASFVDSEIPPNCVVFFIPVKGWLEFKEVKDE